MTDESGIYLFCFGRAHIEGQLEGEGIDPGFPLATCKFEDVAAVTSQVRVRDFSGPEAEACMRDLGWLGPRACRHETVIEQVMRLSPVLPVQFGTLFSSPERLAEFLAGHCVAISRFLDFVTGMEEWGVKVLVDRTRVRGCLLSDLASTDAESQALSPGQRYFRERRARADAEKRMGRWLKTACARIAREISRAACRSRPRKVVDWRSEGDGKEVILNWAFLVAEARVGMLRASVDQLNADYATYGLVLEVSGPWPPYSFGPSFEGNT